MGSGFAEIEAKTLQPHLSKWEALCRATKRQKRLVRWKLMMRPTTGMLQMMMRERWTDSGRCLSGTRESLVRVAQVYETPISIENDSPSDRG